MNRELLDKLATWLEDGAKHEYVTFDMSTGIRFTVEDFKPRQVTQCKTSCCLAGAAVQFYNEPQELANKALRNSLFGDFSMGDAALEIPWGYVMNEARKVLDLTDIEAGRLFEPQFVWGGNLYNYNNPAWAARTIRRFLDTGLVDWEAAK